MTTSISDLKRDTFGIVLSFLSPRDWGRTSIVCKTWNEYIKNNTSINEQITILRRLPKILHKNLPNRKLPILQVGGVVVDPNPKTKKPLLRFGGEENWATNKINIVTPHMMIAPIMLVKDPLNRVGVALKYTHQIKLKEKEERVIVLHEFGGEHKGVWTSGQNKNNIINASGRATILNSRHWLINTAMLHYLFPDNWNSKCGISQTFLSKLLQNESCGILKVDRNGSKPPVTVTDSTEDNFIHLSL